MAACLPAASRALLPTPSTYHLKGHPKNCESVKISQCMDLKLSRSKILRFSSVSRASRPFTPHRWQPRLRSELRAQAEKVETPAGDVPTSDSENENRLTGSALSLDKQVSKVVRKTAGTFAPRASAPSKNPAVKGTTLYTVFEVQAWISIAIGGLLSFNVLFPSDQPDIWRMLGMWSVWMFAIPSLRARDCSSAEKDALNYLFLIVPLINVLIPVFWKSFAGVFTADIIAMAGMYAWKLDWLKDENPSE